MRQPQPTRTGLDLMGRWLTIIKTWPLHQAQQSQTIPRQQSKTVPQATTQNLNQACHIQYSLHSNMDESRRSPYLEGLETRPLNSWLGAIRVLPLCHSCHHKVGPNSSYLCLVEFILHQPKEHSRHLPFHFPQFFHKPQSDGIHGKSEDARCDPIQASSAFQITTKAKLDHAADYQKQSGSLWIPFGSFSLQR